MPLEHIERIEVIRGPGGTVWGANAVNGVINIITRSAKTTQGGLISAGSGSTDTIGSIQYGGAFGAKGAYRAFGRYFNVGRSAAPTGGPASDGRHGLHGGFWADWDLSSQDTLMVQGDLLESRERETLTGLDSNALPLRRTFTSRIAVDGGNILGRWNHILSNGSDMSLQVYYDGYRRINGGLSSSLDTVDLDFQHRLALGRHDIVWGLGYRVTDDNYTPGTTTRFVPPHSRYSLFSAFAEDEIRLTSALSFTLGSKFEHNAFTGFEYQPSAQLVWTATDRQAFWLSAARAIQQPSRSDVGLQVDAATFPINGGATFGLIRIVGAPNPKAEQLLDFEAGYRAQAGKGLSLDLVTFSSHYRQLQTSEPRAPYFSANPPPPHLVFPYVFDYLARARTYGVEFFASWNATKRWRITPGYSLLQMAVVQSPSSKDLIVAQTPGDTPKHQAQIRSWLNLRRNVDWDSSLAYVGGLRNGNVARYTRLDTRVAWRLGESVELSFGSQNLLKPRHQEFYDAFGVLSTQIERNVYGRVTWRF